MLAYAHIRLDIHSDQFTSRIIIHPQNILFQDYLQILPTKGSWSSKFSSGKDAILSLDDITQLIADLWQEYQKQDSRIQFTMQRYIALLDLMHAYMNVQHQIDARSRHHYQSQRSQSTFDSLTNQFEMMKSSLFTLNRTQSQDSPMRFVTVFYTQANHSECFSKLLELIKDIFVNTIDRSLERGEKINLLVSRVDENESVSFSFKSRKTFSWKDKLCSCVCFFSCCSSAEPTLDDSFSDTNEFGKTYGVK